MTFFKQLISLLRISHSVFGKVFDKDSFFFVFPNVQVRPVTTKHVADKLVVNLKTTGPHHEGGFAIAGGLNILEDLINTPGDNAFQLRIVVENAFHCVGLASAGLSIDNYGSIESFKSRLHGQSCSVLVYFRLLTVLIIDPVEIKADDVKVVFILDMLLQVLIRNLIDVGVFKHENLFLTSRHLNRRNEPPVLDFTGQGRTHSHHHLERRLLRLLFIY